LEELRKKIQLFKADSGIKIFNDEDLNNELNNLYETIKQDLSNQFKMEYILYKQLIVKIKF